MKPIYEDQAANALKRCKRCFVEDMIVRDRVGLFLRY
jgi:hypothetical protein